MSVMAVTRFWNTSSLSAMNNERTFSACERCLSNRSSNDDRTVCLMSGSTENQFVRPRCLCLCRLTWICNSDSEQLFNDVCDNLDGVIAQLMNNGIPYEKATTSQCRPFPYFWGVVLKIRQCACSDKFIQSMSCKRRAFSDAMQF